MLKIIRPALVIFVFFTLLTGILYPLLITGVAQGLFPQQANGSLITGLGGEAVGSEIIGQSFMAPEYFWGRLSATAEHPYNAAASGGSNYSALNQSLLDSVEARISALQAEDPDNKAAIPLDLVTASASGLDPHISPAAAYYQVSRIARLRSLTEEQVRDLVDRHIEQPFLGIFGEPRVNVLMLNLALDTLK